MARVAAATPSLKAPASAFHSMVFLHGGVASALQASINFFPASSVVHAPLAAVSPSRVVRRHLTFGSTVQLASAGAQSVGLVAAAAVAEAAAIRTATNFIFKIKVRIIIPH